MEDHRGDMWCPLGWLRVADLGALGERPGGDLTQDRPKRKPADRGMKKGRIEIDHIVMTATPLAQVDHAVVPQVSHYAPHCALRQIEIPGDLLDGRIRTDSYIEEHAALRREK